MLTESRLPLILFIVIAVSACSVSRPEYPVPHEVALFLSGEIDPRLKYRVAVEYRTTVADKSCEEFNPYMAERERAKQWFYYEPDLVGLNHKVMVPLREIDPLTKCQWRPNIVFLCFASRSSDAPANSCSDLFFIDETAPSFSENVVLTRRTDGEQHFSSLLSGGPVKRIPIENSEVSVSIVVESGT